MNAYSGEKLQEKVQGLARAGFTKEWLRSHYDEGMGKKQLAVLMNSKVERKYRVDTRWLTAIFAHYSLRERTPEENEVLRIAKVKAYNATAPKIYKEVPAEVAERAIALFSEGQAVASIAKEVGITPHLVNRVVADAGLPSRPYYNHKLLLTELETIGLGLPYLRSRYLDANCGFEELRKEIEEKVAHPVGEKILATTLKRNNVIKSKALIAHRQGLKSREEKAANLAKLERAGFTPETLARYYVRHYHLSYKALAKELNELLGEAAFTGKWVERRVVPHLTEEERYGVSRQEKCVRDLVKKLYSGPILFNDRELIAPYEVDIVLPERKLAIEYNGTYWHSDKFLLINHGMNSWNYHKRKRSLLRAQGYELAFLWEADWVKRPTQAEKALELFLATGKPPALLAKLH